MRHIVRFSLISLAAMFAGAYVLVRTSARGPIRAADLRSGSFAKPESARSIPDFRDSPGDQAAAETTTDRNEALPLKPPDALGNKIMATVQGLVDDNPVMRGTCPICVRDSQHESRTRLSFMRSGVCAELREKTSVSQRQWRTAQLLAVGVHFP